jgi:pyruvyltransferase
MSRVSEVVSLSKSILNDPSTRTNHFLTKILSLSVESRVPMYWANHEMNLGDALAPIIAQQVLGVKPSYASTRRKNKLLGLGSVIYAARHGDAVWGSGAFGDSGWNPEGIEVLALRGPLTSHAAGIRHDVPFADPGIFVNEIVPTVAPEKREGRLIIPHYTEYAGVAACIARHPMAFPDVRVLNLQEGDSVALLRMIASSELVVSSSLHGLVFAEALGVHAVWVTPGSEIRGGNFKFRDYYLGTGRNPPIPIAWGDANKEDLSRPDLPDFDSDRKYMREAVEQWWNRRMNSV